MAYAVIKYLYYIYCIYCIHLEDNVSFAVDEKAYTACKTLTSFTASRSLLPDMVLEYINKVQDSQMSNASELKYSALSSTHMKQFSFCVSMRQLSCIKTLFNV